jgi:NAD(P)-dependent dehydrogenase (short-subunit alcohol dehydrogenase family)
VYATMRDLDRKQALLREAEASGVAPEIVQLDVTSPSSIADALSHIMQQSGRVDVLVNNAGTALGGFFEDVSIQELRAQFETNFFGMVDLTQRLLPHMRSRGKGKVIVVSSKAGRAPVPGLSAYCASKWAVEGLFEALRYELAPYGISVVLVEPGTFRTDIFTRNRTVAAKAFDPASAYFKKSKQLETYIEHGLKKATQDPRRVAKLIARVAQSANPRLRYLIGQDAKQEAWAREKLPAWLYERIVRMVTDKIFRT